MAGAAARRHAAHSRERPSRWTRQRSVLAEARASRPCSRGANPRSPAGYVSRGQSGARQPASIAQAQLRFGRLVRRRQTHQRSRHRPSWARPPANRYAQWRRGHCVRGRAVVVRVHPTIRKGRDGVAPRAPRLPWLADAVAAPINGQQVTQQWLATQRAPSVRAAQRHPTARRAQAVRSEPTAAATTVSQFRRSGRRAA